ncbi:thiolase domain-containing protein [Candidatus Geothermarchaeota archaeon]|nr:MAG: thiolase domain-containing protein [Candidatus Geothermarchaeota archaeon]HEW93255.1 thiolase domain-containing protein [Thermoprotei archaeon]
MKVAIIGAGMTRFDRPRRELQEEMVAEAMKNMLEDMPNLEIKDIDAAVYSYFSDHLEQQLCFHWIIHDYLGLSGKPGYRVESGGATPIDALINAYMYIKSGIFKVVLAAGWEKMGEVDTAKVNEFIAMASDTDWDFMVGGYYNGYYAALEVRRMHLYGDTIEDLALISVKNHNNATYNPYAQWRARHGTGKITVEDVYKSRLIAYPYRTMNIAEISDGAAVMLLASEEVARKYTDTPVWITGVGLGNDSMRPGDRTGNPAWLGLYPEDEAVWPDYEPKPLTPYPEMANFGAFRYAADMAYKMAGIENPVKDLDLVEIFNPYDGVEISAYEDLRFVKRGEGKKLIREGVTERWGELPVNVSGGLYGQGHPVGATSLGQAVVLFWQLREEISRKWGSRNAQIQNPRRALIHGHGGTGCQAGVVIMER